jgi:CRISPR/Cas system CMR-associated protein Cmr3 (group 5 of RAMP superfamily)
MPSTSICSFIVYKAQKVAKKEIRILLIEEKKKSNQLDDHQKDHEQQWNHSIWYLYVIFLLYL